MSYHLQREMDKLKKEILHLSAQVEESLRWAVKSVHQRDRELAKKVVEMDEEIDRMEIEVEEECLKVLALHQPVAIDLRFLVAVLKLNSDLERIGDLSVNIAERTIYEISKYEGWDFPFDFTQMMQKVQTMLKKSLDALIERDAYLARQVCLDDQEVDNLHRQTYEAVKKQIEKKPSHFDRLLPLLSVSRQLERIADHATNIAEDVIYMIDGEIVRHQSWEEGE